MKDFIIKLTQLLVDHPEDVSVEESSDAQGEHYVLIVNPADMGQIIGKSGKVIRGLRDLVRVKAIKSGLRASLLLSEPLDQTN